MDSDNPSAKDLKIFRQKLEEIPGLWQVFGDLPEIIRSQLIQKITNTEVQQIGLSVGIKKMQEEMGYLSANRLEKLLIENILISWLRLQWVEYQLSVFIGKSHVRFVEIQHWERRLNASQRRFLRATEALARLRKLLRKSPPSR